MTVATLLTGTVTILRRTEGAEDVYGNEADVFTPVGSYACRLEQRSGEERTFGRDVQMSDWVLFLEPTTVIFGKDRVTDGFGRTFEVVGPATMLSTPTRDVLVEASLIHIEGG